MSGNLGHGSEPEYRVGCEHTFTKQARLGDCNLALQVGEVEAVFLALKADVEALFMTAPSVNLAELAHEVADAHRHLEGQVCSCVLLSCLWLFGRTSHPPAPCLRSCPVP